MGNHPTVCRLMRGVFNLQPPSKPKPPVWDVELLLSFMDTWGPSDSLTLPQTTCRTLLLLLLTSAARIGEIADLQYPPSSRQPHRWEFTYGRGLTKTSRQGQHAPTFVVKPYPPNHLRCPITALTAYDILTLPHRPVPSSLFLTSRKPYRSASKDTLARWVKTTIHAAGIDATLYTAHSTRAASTTAAHTRGLQLPDILKTAQWTRATTFYNHYYRPPPQRQCPQPCLIHNVKIALCPR
ncbi:uncharacterized protein LOC100905808 [Galendromus occidentalis]|uniref:Uncharacterized protein LOC100905808 n=1 Tax=Galendromus occidentalis TaxID=34638 RepID=A0AAJ6VVB6_9ACAR|nr:uncharacterized protein LOC100905808 [Galendromus occidentalis]